MCKIEKKQKKMNVANKSGNHSQKIKVWIKPFQKQRGFGRSQNAALILPEILRQIPQVRRQ